MQQTSSNDDRHTHNDNGKVYRNPCHLKHSAQLTSLANAFLYVKHRAIHPQGNEKMV